MPAPYGPTVLEHFRRPRNQERLEGANVSAEGSNPLCGDRVRVEMRVSDGRVLGAAFTANACAICTASASLVTEHARGMRVEQALSLSVTDVVEWLQADLPPARLACATLPLRTLHLALGELASRA